MGKKEKKRDLTKGERSPALLAQPDPKSDAADVWPLVIRDMQDRDHLGKVKYGIPLRMHNGRDALVDAYQEVLDLSVYLRQEIEERGFLRDALDELRKVPGCEKATISTIGKSIKDLVDFCNKTREQNRILASTLVHHQTSSPYITGFDDGVEAAIRTIEQEIGREIEADIVDKVYASSGVTRQREND
jgi:hypothetical protein